MRRAVVYATTIVTIVAPITVFLAGPAAADPPASSWASLRQCESTDTYDIDTGNGYYGAYQFDLPTWRSVGGSGSPADASPAEQDYRALYLYRMRGWSPWSCASIVGLREDAAAGSGVVPTRADSAYIGGGGSPAPAPVDRCRVGASSPPSWAGSTMTIGHSYSALVCWQQQMNSRGVHFTGTGYFGTNTLAAAHDLQARYGLARRDGIDAATWSAAWGVRTTAPAPAPAPSPAPTPVAGVWPGLTAKACSVGAATAPAWPKVPFSVGAHDRALACWQMQMGSRGYPLKGSGDYGANTLAAAKDLQLRNGLGGSGVIGPKTWKAAWEGAGRK